MPAHPLRVAVVCSSNQNRSMEAHNILSKRGFDVRSFGTGTHVKLPGPAPDKPNIYDFKTTYEQMYNDLVRKDKELYTQNGILHMLDRNKRIKTQPERFQSCKEQFDLVITCEERVYDQVLEGECVCVCVRPGAGGPELARAGDLSARARHQRGHPGQPRGGDSGSVPYL
ncbi:RNA polymerase II subunit A C-terminal domain phosphatase SSU72 isoform X2 [Carassius gibelio]|uniref:RNA polymerase II subunit A C-terminal domain phosphatase SSU72 isoform X2 n=1 Tax=Carassius gibelio TaxID=101364 RepID=UPI00227759D0|nr:RNA polymerase II subunit A C-terminal domain phosphatase SSU72 isoform X2 [Carassius gibelio]